VAFDEATRLQQEGKYAEATAKGEHALGLREAALGSAHPEVAVRTVPAAAGDVHDLDGLRGMADALTGADGDTPTGVPRRRILPARRR